MGKQKNPMQAVAPEAPKQEPAKEPVTLAEYEAAIVAENNRLEQLKQAGKMLNQEITNSLIKMKTFQAVIKALKDNGK